MGDRINIGQGSILPLAIHSHDLEPDQEAGLMMLVECLDRGTKALSAMNEAKGRENEGEATEEDKALIHYGSPLVRVFAAAAEGAMVTNMTHLLQHREEAKALQATAFHIAAVMFCAGIEYGKHLSLGVAQEQPAQTEQEGAVEHKEEPNGGSSDGGEDV